MSLFLKLISFVFHITFAVMLQSGQQTVDCVSCELSDNVSTHDLSSSAIKKTLTGSYQNSPHVYLL